MTAILGNSKMEDSKGRLEVEGSNAERGLKL